ncbi:MAG: hypothetical protein ABIA93_00380 [Candidatus Woesearchaeota archaeon]
MLPQTHIEVLRILVNKLARVKFWLVIGSTNLAMQGVDVVPKDIDILTDKEGAYAIGVALSEYVVLPVAFRENEFFKSYFGRFIINGMDVEIMGDRVSKIPGGDTWGETKGYPAKMLFDIDGVKVPVLSLEQEYKAYVKFGRTEKAEKIHARINSLKR